MADRFRRPRPVSRVNLPVMNAGNALVRKVLLLETPAASDRRNLAELLKFNPETARRKIIVVRPPPLAVKV